MLGDSSETPGKILSVDAFPGHSQPTPSDDADARAMSTDPSPGVHSADVRHIMGMPIGIDVRDPLGIDADVAFDWLREVDATFSTYRPDSDISRLDRGELMIAECRPEVEEVLAKCLQLERATRGYFSVRPVGRLDPSGFVKGWAVAEAARRLATAGPENFCINAGG